MIPKEKRFSGHQNTLILKGLLSKALGWNYIWKKLNTIYEISTYLS